MPIPRRHTSKMLDFSGGVVGGISDYGRGRVRHLRIAENVLLRPHGALRVREGSQRLSSAVLTAAPHSVMEWVTSAGAGHIFVASDGTAGVVNEITTGAITLQTLPFPLAATGGKLVWDQLQGTIWATENVGATPPFFFRSGNPANTWHTGILPRPAFPAMPTGLAVAGPNVPLGATVNGAVAAGATTFNLSIAATAAASSTLTFGTAPYTFQVPNCQTVVGVAVTYDTAAAAAQAPMTLTDAGVGGLTAGTTYSYRLRFRYLHGSSRASAVVTLAAPLVNTQVQITNMVQEIRSDYIGWTLERTKTGGTAAGPFYFVADGTGAAYNDIIADADLGYRSDENVHGEPPHLDGILAYKDRLVGWAGSTVYFSQAVGDIEATGIANWNALNASDIGPDDGDTIKSIVLQVDRLVVLKRWSVWAVEGDDINSYRAFPLFKGAGCSGCRAAAAVGAVVYFWGDGQFHRIVGNRVEPFGWLEVGHLFDTFRQGQYGDVVVKNYLGQAVCISYSSSTSTNDDMLVYDQRFGAWTRITGWYWHDFLVQKAGSFGDSQAVVAIDRRDLDATGAFDYPVWLGLYGFKDQKAANGSGGAAPTVVIETPMLDDGAPDVTKDWERIQLFLAGTSVTASVTITTDPQHTSAISVVANQAGAVWAAATWGAFNWVQAIDSGPYMGLPSDTAGRRYSLRLVAQPDADFIFKGYAMDGIVQPVADYSRS